MSAEVVIRAVSAEISLMCIGIVSPNCLDWVARLPRPHSDTSLDDEVKPRRDVIGARLRAVALTRDQMR